MKTHTHKQDGFGHVGLLAAVVIIAVVGFAGWRVYQNNGSEPQLSVDDTQRTPIADLLPDDLSSLKALDEIQTIAQGQQPDKTITGVELESEHNMPVYVIHFSDGTILVFDALTGEQIVVNDNQNDEIDDSKSFPSGFTAGISIQDAIAAAKAQHPNVSVKKVELETEEGVIVYSVRFVDGARVDISANDGSINRIKDASGNTTQQSNVSDSHENETESENESHDAGDDNGVDGSTHDENEDDHSGSGSGSGSSGSGSSNSGSDDHSGSGHGSDDD